eukprot:4488963-Ditylum_brightwellii.AAC.1
MDQRVLLLSQKKRGKLDLVKLVVIAYPRVYMLNPPLECAMVVVGALTTLLQKVKQEPTMILVVAMRL